MHIISKGIFLNKIFTFLKKKLYSFIQGKKNYETSGVLPSSNFMRKVLRLS